MTARVEPGPRLRDVLERIERRKGSTPPAAEAIVEAVRLIAERSGNKGGISRHVSPATVYEIEDGENHHMVVLFELRGEISRGLCSCWNDSVCEHMLAVLAGLGTPPLSA